MTSSNIVSGHTPAPWVWWTSNSWKRLRASQRGVDTNVLYPAVLADGQPTIDVSDEDMALIAAAPDLLARLKQTREWIAAIGDDTDWKHDQLDLIDADIALAEGAK